MHRLPPADPATPPAPAAGESPRRGTGTLFLVVGPSGVGKDSLIDAARQTLAGDGRFVFVRRVVTRPADAGGEAHEAMGLADFQAARERGDFAVFWSAHGLGYGIRNETLAALGEGCNVVVNASRRAVKDFLALGERVVVLSVTAPAEVVRRRLEARGREDAAEVAARLARDVPLAGIPHVATIDNGADLATGTRAFVGALLGGARLALTLARSPVELAGEGLALLPADSAHLAGRQVFEGGIVEVRAGARSVRARLAVASAGLLAADAVALTRAPFARLGAAEGAEVHIARAPLPATRDILRKTVAGEELSAAEIGRLVRDLVERGYTDAEVAGFLTAVRRLSVAEAAALTAARAESFERIDWGGRLVVDNQLGGVAGSRITMIVVPIVAAHGLLIPNTSSRAITSAAGTADVMGCIARVDLMPGQLKHVVEATGGAIARSDRISHDPLDGVMNAVARPLGIRSAVLDVSSVLSRTLAVGATHVVVDIPLGPGAEMRSASSGRAIADLFVEVGRSVGLVVNARVTDASRLVGSGVGPALELCDVEAVLANDPAAPQALREEALAVAAALIAWDPAVPEGAAFARAKTLLDSGAAEAGFRAIAAAQGEIPRARPGPFTLDLAAPAAGTVWAIDGDALAELARFAGAPADNGAGVRILAAPGASVRRGEPVLQVAASSRAALDALESDLEAVVRLRPSPPPEQDR